MKKAIKDILLFVWLLVSIGIGIYAGIWTRSISVGVVLAGWLFSLGLPS